MKSKIEYICSGILVLNDRNQDNPLVARRRYCFPFIEKLFSKRCGCKSCIGDFQGEFIQYLYSNVRTKTLFIYKKDGLFESKK